MPEVKNVRKAAVSLKSDTKILKTKSVPLASKTKKAKPKTKKPKLESKVDKHYVVVDHPQNKEIISGLHYAIRIGASESGNVEISFDDGEWISCRNIAGYWWFDWGYFTPGVHKIVARVVDHDRKLLKKSAIVRCEVF